MKYFNWKKALIYGGIVFGALVLFALVGQPIVDAIANAFATPTATPAV